MEDENTKADPIFQGIDDSEMDFQYEDDINKLDGWFYRIGSPFGDGGSGGSGGSSGTGDGDNIENTLGLEWDDLTGKEEPPTSRARAMRKRS